MTRDDKGHLVFGIYWQTKKCIVKIVNSVRHIFRLSVNPLNSSGFPPRNLSKSKAAKENRPPPGDSVAHIPRGIPSILDCSPFSGCDEVYTLTASDFEFCAAFGAPRSMFDPPDSLKIHGISRPFHRAKVHQHGLNLFVRQDEHGVQQILGSESQRKHTVVFFTYVSHGLSYMRYIYDLLGPGVQRVMAMETSSGEEVLSQLNTIKTILSALSFHLEVKNINVPNPFYDKALLKLEMVTIQEKEFTSSEETLTS